MRTTKPCCYPSKWPDNRSILLSSEKPDNIQDATDPSQNLHARGWVVDKKVPVCVLHLHDLTAEKTIVGWQLGTQLANSGKVAERTAIGFPKSNTCGPPPYTVCEHRRPLRLNIGEWEQQRSACGLSHSYAFWQMEIGPRVLTRRCPAGAARSGRGVCLLMTNCEIHAPYRGHRNL